MAGRTAISLAIFFSVLFVLGCGESAQDRAERAYQQGLDETKHRNYKEALKLFREATELDPKMAVAFRGRGYVLGKMGQKSKAVAEYQKAIQADPSFALAYQSRGRLYLGAGKYDAAIKDFTKAIELQPFTRSAHRYRGIAKYEKGLLDKALIDFDKAISINNKHSKGFYWRGMVHFTKGNYERAVADFSEAVWHDDEYAEAYSRRGWALFELGKYNAAISDSEKAIEFDPELADAYCNLARIYAMAGDSEVRDGKKATKFGARACQMTQLKSWYCLTAAAAAYAEAGDFARAQKLQKMAIRQAPPDEQEQLASGLAQLREKKPFRKIPSRETARRPGKAIMTGSS